MTLSDMTAIEYLFSLEILPLLSNPPTSSRRFPRAALAAWPSQSLPDRVDPCPFDHLEVS